ncbi:MAG: CBS domain-containing protein [Deltaproteobacteria bacterium]|nr:CBS domain-containing protein [Deltaproteobacteria bacterium]
MPKRLMDEIPKQCEFSDEDLGAALEEMKGYVDITEDDLKKIYAIALRHAAQRVANRVMVRDVMTRNVIKVREEADINEVTTLLSENRISGLPVVDGGGRVIGVVTEADVLSMAGMNKEHAFRDIIRHILGEPLPAHSGSKKLRDVMSSPAITTGPEADIRDVALTIDEKRIKRLPVVDEQGRLIGLISRADIVRVIGTK